jgi:pantothenate kinase type III
MPGDQHSAELKNAHLKIRNVKMTKAQNSVSMLTVVAIMLGLFAAPALAIAASAKDNNRKISGAGFVLMVSLQRNAS